MKETKIITGNTEEFLKFLKSRFPLIHLSNFFFRDFHYGVMAFLEKNGKKLKYLEAENIAKEAAADLENKGIFKRIDHQSWLLQYPEFALPRVEKPAPVKAAVVPEKVSS